MSFLITLRDGNLSFGHYDSPKGYLFLGPFEVAYGKKRALIGPNPL